MLNNWQKKPRLNQRLKLSLINICCHHWSFIYLTQSLTELAGAASDSQKPTKQLQDLYEKEGTPAQNSTLT